MTFTPRKLALAACLWLAAGFPGVAQAQVAPLFIDHVQVTGNPPAQPSPGSPLAAPAALDAGFVNGTFPRHAAQGRSGGLGPVAIGALIGGAVALGATAVAASRYGYNEGGQFCSRCFVQWSAFTVPVGVGAGAAIGWGLRRSVTAVPVVSPNGAGVVVSARF